MIFLAFAASLIPALAVYLIFRKRQPEKEGYAADIKTSLINGIKSTFLLLPFALAFHIIGTLIKINDVNIWIRQLYKDVFMAGFLEEAVKMVMFRKVLKKSSCEYSWLDVTAYAVLVGLGFETLEAIVYAFMTNPAQVIVRGITMMHGMFQFIMGYFYAKGLYTKKKIYFVLSFMLPFLYHGTYDYMLAEEFSGYGDIFAFVPVTLALLSLILVFVMIRFFRRKKDVEKFNVSLRPAIQAAGDESAAEIPSRQNEDVTDNPYTEQNEVQ
jgi:RsiW-degrading membrane proteinase PrsW (M82 family)